MPDSQESDELSARVFDLSEMQRVKILAHVRPGGMLAALSADGNVIRFPGLLAEIGLHAWNDVQEHGANAPVETFNLLFAEIDDEDSDTSAFIAHSTEMLALGGQSKDDYFGELCAWLQSDFLPQISTVSPGADRMRMVLRLIWTTYYANMEHGSIDIYGMIRASLGVLALIATCQGSLLEGTDDGLA